MTLAQRVLVVVLTATVSGPLPLSAQTGAEQAEGSSAAPRPIALNRATVAERRLQDSPLVAERTPVGAGLSITPSLLPRSGSPAPWWAPVASGVIPGAGQFALRQQRSVAYAVAEGFLLVQYFTARRDGNRERDAYRALARDVARRGFGGTAVGTWDYYEILETFLESGAYDRIPGGALDPETDPLTYNGSRWLGARRIFWVDPDVAPATNSPEYQRALDAYRRSAVTDEFRWSWRDAQNEQDVYVQTIRSANRSYQRAVNLLGVVAVNHLASLIDAYVSVRLRRYGGVRVGNAVLDGVQVGVMPAAPGGSALDAGWYTGLRFSVR